MKQNHLRGLLLMLAVACLCGCGASREELVAAHNSTINAFCLDCHNDVEQVSDLTLESLDVGRVAADRATWESVVRKLRGGMMPPPDGGARPDPVAYTGLTEWLEQELDAAYVPTLPPPGMHRLNRAEYANAVRDLLALEVDTTEFLPADDSSRGFDNQAGTLNLSSSLLEAYLAAAGRISRLAIGTANDPKQSLYRVAEDATQNYHVEGLPFGTRGGILIEHQFPVDGEYNIKVFAVNLGNMGNFRPFGEVRGEQLEVLLNGERVALIDWDEAFNVGRGLGGGTGQLQTIDVPVQVTAGPQQLGVTFLASDYAPLLDLNNDFERSTIETGGLPGFTSIRMLAASESTGPTSRAAPVGHPAAKPFSFVSPRKEPKKPLARATY